MGSYVEHAQLLAKSLEDTKKFYTFVFNDWKLRAEGREVGGLKEYDWIHVGNDSAYMAFRGPYLNSEEKMPSLELMCNHIGIVVDDINSVINRLESIDAEVIRSENPNRIRVYTRDPSGYELELIQYNSDKPELRNDYSWDIKKGNTLVNVRPKTDKMGR